jgi:hypothetical protein
MNAPLPPHRDDDIDRLLARQYRDTSPEFEARWTELKRGFRQTPRRTGTARFAWPIASLAGLAALVALVVAVFRPEPAPPVPQFLNPSAEMSQVLAMDEVLRLALPLLDDENRLALLHLPVPGQRKP